MEYTPRTMAQTRLLMRDPMECSVQVEESHLHLLNSMEIALALELDAQFVFGVRTVDATRKTVRLRREDADDKNTCSTYNQPALCAFLALMQPSKGWGRIVGKSFLSTVSLAVSSFTRNWRRDGHSAKPQQGMRLYFRMSQ